IRGILLLFYRPSATKSGMPIRRKPKPNSTICSFISSCALPKSQPLLERRGAAPPAYGDGTRAVDHSGALTAFFRKTMADANPAAIPNVIRVVLPSSMPPDEFAFLWNEDASCIDVAIAGVPHRSSTHFDLSLAAGGAVALTLLS